MYVRIYLMSEVTWLYPNFHDILIGIRWQKQGIRVTSGIFGHQARSDINLNTVDIQMRRLLIQMRRLLMSRLIRILTVGFVIIVFISITIHTLFFKKSVEDIAITSIRSSVCPSVMLSPPKSLDWIQTNLTCELLTWMGCAMAHFLGPAPGALGRGQKVKYH